MRHKHGFTLVELLVVIAIIAMLTGLLIPAVMQATQRARQETCSNHMGQIWLAIAQFETAKGQMPYLRSTQFETAANPPIANPQSTGWVPPLLPYLERNDLFRIYQNADGGGYNNPALMVQVDFLICPSDSRRVNRAAGAPPQLSYAVNSGRWDQAAGSSPLDWKENGVFFDDFGAHGTALYPAYQYPSVSTDLAYIAAHDGTSNTILLSENMDSTVWQTSTGDAGPQFTSIVWWNPGASGAPIPCPPIGLNAGSGSAQPGSIAAGLVTAGDIARPSSAHLRGYLVAYCDGSVQFMSSDVQYYVYAALMTPAGSTAKDPGTQSLATFQNVGISDAQLNP